MALDHEEYEYPEKCDSTPNKRVKIAENFDKVVQIQILHRRSAI